MKTIKKLTRHYTKDGTFISHHDTMCLSEDVEKLESITDEMLEALKAIRDLMIENDLVRDISKDNDFEHFTKQGFRIANAVDLMNKAIKKATE